MTQAWALPWLGQDSAPEDTYHKLRYRQWLAILVQGHIGEEGTGGPVPLL